MLRKYRLHEVWVRGSMEWENKILHRMSTTYGKGSTWWHRLMEQVGMHLSISKGIKGIIS